MRDATLFFAVVEVRDLVRSGFGLRQSAERIADQCGINEFWLLAKAAEAELACSLARAERAEQLAKKGIDHAE